MEDSPRLLMPREEARERISTQIEKGQDLLKLVINSWDDLEQAEHKKERWSDFNKDLLRQILSTDKFFHDYVGGVHGVGIGGSPPLDSEIQRYQRSVRDDINRLQSILGRLDLYSFEQERPATQRSVRGNKVFIVHGHDLTARDQVNEFVKALGLETIILMKEASKGQAIIEKFEGTVDEVGYAIVLLTPDDIGGAKSDPSNLRPRARQNVIYELGYFSGRLSRSHVCAFFRPSEDLEIPSDIHGVVLLSLEAKWQNELIRELRAAGLIS